MRRKKVGPFPLLDGLQLVSARATPGGLLRALNVEPRDGLLVTRGGQTRLSAFDGAATPGNDVCDWETPPITYHPADIEAQTVVSAGIDVTSGLLEGGTAIGGQQMIVYLVAPAANTAEAQFSTVEYWNGTAWTALDWERITADLSVAGRPRYAGKVFGSFYAAAASEFISIIIPNDWVRATPSGYPSARNWLRFTFDAALSFGGSAIPGAGVGVYFMRPEFMRFASLVVIRGRDGVEYRGALSGNYLFDVMSGEIVCGLASADSGAGVATDWLSAPWTNDVILTVGRRICSLPMATWADSGAWGSADIGALIPEVPEEYADIACLEQLPRASCLAVHGQRVFMADLDDSDGGDAAVRWSAPGEFWKTWPAANFTTLGTKGESGRIVAMREMDDELVVFTTAGIWRLVITDATLGNESDLFVQFAEATPCTSAKSVALCGDLGIVFLAPDGLRLYRGGKSKPISKDIAALFQSEHTHTCIRPDSCVGQWDRATATYRMFYATPGARWNDAELAWDSATKTFWVHGEPVQTALTTGPAGSTGLTGRRSRGVRAMAAAWSDEMQAVLVLDEFGQVFALNDAALDAESPIKWSLETHPIGVADARRGVMSSVEAVVRRDHFQPFTVTVIPDGNYDRADARSATVEPDRMSTSAELGEGDLSGAAMLNIEESYGPVRWRGRKSGRNHRIKIEGVSPGYARIALLSLAADVAVDEEGR